MELAEINYAHVFRETLEGYRYDFVRLYKMLESCKDDNTKIKIIKTISDIRYKYTQQLAQFPAVWSMEIFVKKNSPHHVEQPTLPSLSDTTGIRK